MHALKNSEVVSFQLVPQLVDVCVLTEENPNSDTKLCLNQWSTTDI